jgi:hypothetical protein
MAPGPVTLMTCSRWAVPVAATLPVKVAVWLVEVAVAVAVGGTLVAVAVAVAVGAVVVGVAVAAAGVAVAGALVGVGLAAAVVAVAVAGALVVVGVAVATDWVVVAVPQVTLVLPLAAFSALQPLMRPAPKVVSLPAAPRSSTLLIMKFTTCWLVSEGLAEMMSPAKPATWGEAKEVPATAP